MKSFSNIEKQKIIFNAYSNPQYNLKNKKEGGIFEHSSICVDELTLYLTFQNNVLIKANYFAEGCAVFIASVELVIEQLLNKNKEDINKILDAYFEMINQKEYDSNVKLNKLIVFENVKAHLNRLECASIVYRAFKKGING
ncbi:iron-sulfur cluster assembly scaffold protein [Mycoplasma enhydrae]|uniref:iron-sulfur cluster assembly scaffold protein n=1 Tax=Mycoplasma enhydrae TaxID=2499220 RepID=UPI00197B672D|nr:iron-sulfur cluster assembly scaffold protein [Mycoplasma enhydrae]MBN4089408.1 iron-sulfur cluster assembly scaffold protein [Mycoplasma enhydrae]MCV3733464.1 iron-sulfur cluster assembly scaffold protein [Mycoplasma enhydrae]MCV3753288.1 iron-sulfur cluster assembly scaffold protein [Mycoplasma enhydrae]